MNARKAAFMALAVCFATRAFAETRHVSFVTCPIFRDAVRQCWLAEYHGDVYYIGRYGLAQPPQLLHKVLVEGTVADEPRSCGGVVLSPVHLSVMPEVDTSCNTVLPDNGDRPSEPSIFDATPEQLSRIGQEQPLPATPYIDRQFVIGFDLDSTFLNQAMQREVEAAAKYALLSKAARVEVNGYASNSRLDNGDVMTESATIAERRARAVAHAIVAIGVQQSVIDVKWIPESAVGNGIDDSERRNVAIMVKAARQRPR